MNKFEYSHEDADAFDRDEAFERNEDFENLSDSSVKTHTGAVVLWDMLKVSEFE